MFILIFSDTEKTYNVFFWQAIFVLIVWIVSATLMLVDYCRYSDLPQHTVTLMESQGSFIRSLLYNQVPIRSFFNPVTLLALMALTV